MKITLSTLSFYSLSNFHDSEVSQLVVDYTNHRIQIPLKLAVTKDASKKTSMVFNDVKSLRMNIDEQWGPGIYVHEIALKDDLTNKDNEGQTFSTTILLNSGDEIHIACESIEIGD